MTWSYILPPQAVLGALIAVNLKNSLKQLTDPYYLWRKSKLDCVGSGQLGASVQDLPLFQPTQPQPTHEPSGLLFPEWLKIQALAGHGGTRL